MIWWFLIVAAAAGAVFWAALSAYLQVRNRMKKASHLHSESGPDGGHQN